MFDLGHKIRNIEIFPIEKIKNGCSKSRILGTQLRILYLYMGKKRGAFHNGPIFQFN